LIEYYLQILSKEGTYEYSFNIMFEHDISPKISLSDLTKLGNEDFPVPFSIVFGDDDWMTKCDDGCSKYLIKQKKSTSIGEMYRFIVIPDSDHMIHNDNP